MKAGNEWLVDATGCSADSLRNLETVRHACDEVIRDLSLRVVGEPVWHKFPGEGGVTGLYLLMESHLSCHTYPEAGIATFNLYCCRPRNEWPWQERLTELLGASRVIVRFVARGEESEIARQTSLRREVGNR
jgi:S-adenosylmethionine decarboxylase